MVNDEDEDDDEILEMQRKMQEIILMRGNGNYNYKNIEPMSTVYNKGKDASAKREKSAAKKEKLAKNSLPTKPTVSSMEDVIPTPSSQGIQGMSSLKAYAKQVGDKMKDYLGVFFQYSVDAMVNSEEYIKFVARKFLHTICMGRCNRKKLENDTVWLTNYIKEILKIAIGILIGFNIYYICFLHNPAPPDPDAIDPLEIPTVKKIMGYMVDLIYPSNTLHSIMYGLLPWALKQFDFTMEYPRISFLVILVACIYLFIKYGYYLKQMYLDCFQWKTCTVVYLLLVYSILSIWDFYINPLDSPGRSNILPVVKFILFPINGIVWSIVRLILAFSFSPIAQFIYVFIFLFIVLGGSSWWSDGVSPPELFSRVYESLKLDTKNESACNDGGFYYNFDKYIVKRLIPILPQFLFCIFFTMKFILGFMTDQLKLIWLKTGFMVLNGSLSIGLFVNIIYTLLNIQTEMVESETVIEIPDISIPKDIEPPLSFEESKQ